MPDTKRGTVCESTPESFAAPGAPGELPAWFDQAGVRKRVHLRGRWWVTNGYAMIAMAGEPRELELDVCETLEAWLDAPTRSTTPSFPYVRGNADGGELAHYVCDIGESVVALAYVNLVERLFPGCTWETLDWGPSVTWQTTGWGRPIHAVVGGVVVAMLMSRVDRAPARREPPLVPVGGVTQTASGSGCSETPEDRRARLDKRAALVSAIRSITEENLPPGPLTDWQRLRFYIDPDHHRDRTRITQQQLRDANRAADRLVTNLRTVADAYFEMDFTGWPLSAAVPEVKTAEKGGAS